MKLHIYRSRFKQDAYSYEQEIPLKMCITEDCVVTVSRKHKCLNEGELDVKFGVSTYEPVCCENC